MSAREVWVVETSYHMEPGKWSPYLATVTAPARPKWSPYRLCLRKEEAEAIAEAMGDYAFPKRVVRYVPAKPAPKRRKRSKSK